MDKRITDCANEAKDIVRFLYSLDENCMPLYHSDPVSYHLSPLILLFLKSNFFSFHCTFNFLFVGKNGGDDPQTYQRHSNDS